jgi:hypothetical protein
MPLESPVLRDGDKGFLGFASRPNPLTLPAGILQVSENMRLDRGVAKVRKGAKRLADDISPAGTPVTIPFFLTEPYKIIQSTYTGGVFASSVVRSPDEAGSVECIVLAGADRAYTYLPQGTSFSSAAWGTLLAVDSTENFETETGQAIVAGSLPTELAYPSSPAETVETTDKVSMLQAYDRLYLFREADVTRPGWETKYTSTDSGVTGISVSGTTATVCFDGPHGYPAGATVRIEGSTVAAFDGHEYRIVSAAPSGNANRFTIAVPSGTASALLAGIAVRRVKPPMYWDCRDTSTSFVLSTAGIPDVGITYRRLRSAPWASYINNRLVVPDGKQNLMLSDILDPDTFDPYWQSFRVGVGGSDFVVAVHPWVEGAVLVFCRKSIWVAEVQQYPNSTGTAYSIETGINKLTLLTDEIGCSARRSIATAGQFIYFLSDAGVYRLDSRLDLKLRGDTRPLSDPIADKFQALNGDLAYDAVGLYHDNRYYIAVPETNSDKNNAVFIYNQLSEQWESKDVYGFGVGNFLVGDYAGQRRIFVSNQAGKLMLLDEVEEGDESTDSAVDVTIAPTGRIKTRRYDFGDMHSKRFLRTIADVVIPSGATLTTKISTINPDTEETIGTLANDNGGAEDYNMKSPVRFKAHAAEVIYETSNGRPEIRSASIEASPKSLPSTETRNAA